MCGVVGVVGGTGNDRQRRLPTITRRFHISQRPIVEQFRVGDRVKATAYEIDLPCDCGPGQVPPRGLALIDIEIEGN